MKNPEYPLNGRLVGTQAVWGKIDIFLVPAGK